MNMLRARLVKKAAPTDRGLKIFSRVLMAVICLLLPACGFSPIYGSRGEEGRPVAEALSNVAVANIPDRNGQFLRNHLIDRMYFSERPSHSEATLNVTLRSLQTDLGIQKDATTARRQLNFWADYTLQGTDGKQLLKGTAHSVVSYSKLDAQYGTVAAENNATERALNEVGEQIVNRLSVYYAGQKPEERVQATRSWPYQPGRHDRKSPPF